MPKRVVHPPQNSINTIDLSTGEIIQSEPVTSAHFTGTNQTNPFLLVALLLAYGGAVLITVGPPETRLFNVAPLVWWAILVAVTTCMFLRVLQQPSGAVQKSALIVCFCYMHRAMFMHCTVERDCFWSLPLCCSLWGRTIACIGELTFVDMASKQIAPHRNKLIVFLIACAQTISFIGVIKKHYLWFFFENSIWTGCAIVLIFDTFMYNKRSCYQSLPFLLSLFVFYNVYEDLPMYLHRHADKTHLPGYNLAFVEGFMDSLSCGYVGQDAKIWDPQMLWMTLNYTIVPAASIGLLACAETTDDEHVSKRD